ncbi:hypothetical protein VM57_01985 [Stenotrophomonas maltophilia]|uniref:Uncharacterized protein n=1 Tax=Stenotrophomonas maltophilia TaxID=40324 RepID=A0A0F5ZPU0_STEMA|nr:hypothetical protein VM57_01985 [Stenotrophomonas maltophilia]
MRSAVLADVGDAVEHQHRVVGQTAGSGAEQFTACAGQQLFAVERVETGHEAQSWKRRTGNKRPRMPVELRRSTFNRTQP